MAMGEKRRFKRTDFESSGTLWVRGQEMPFTLIDLSLKGALINPQTPDRIAIGDSLRLRVQLPQSTEIIESEATCVHREYEYLGLRFTRIDADSLAHLRRLLELNVGDTAEIDHELSFLTGRDRMT
jgi:hypothetical protein